MSSKTPRRDWFYLVVVLGHLTAMLGVDFVPFYPAGLYEAPSSPLHFVVMYRKWYITTMSDPYYDMDNPVHLFEFLVYVELLVQFPLAIYFIYSKLVRGSLSGAGELAGLVYGIVTGLCTAIVCNDMWHLGPDRISHEAKQTLLYGAYLPYAVLPPLMAIDMSRRLLARLETPKSKKA